MTHLDYFLTSLFLTTVATFLIAGLFITYSDLVYEFGRSKVHLTLQKIAFFALPFAGAILLVINLIF